jgi:hypothetical protein
MFSKLLADAVLLFHFAFVLFAVFGGVAVLVKRQAAWFHVPAVLWSSVINLGGWICPLTYLENYFLSKAGLSGYKGGFIGHFIEPLVYPGGMPRNFELVAGISVILWNALVYALVLLYWKRRQPG